MYDCSEISLGTGGCSLQKLGPDHPGTNHSCPVDAQSSNGEKYTGDRKCKMSMELAMERKPRDHLDPGSMHPKQLTPTPTMQGPPQMRKFKKLAMQTHPQVKQREDIRRDLAERMKFVPPHLRAGKRLFHHQEDPSKIQQRRKSGKWLKVASIAVKGSMAVVKTGATILQANISKLRRPRDTVDLEELPDSRERARAPVLWLSCEGQIDVWEMFSDN